jgi:hypothetical protein
MDDLLKAGCFISTRRTDAQYSKLTGGSPQADLALLEDPMKQRYAGEVIEWGKWAYNGLKFAVASEG